MKFLVAGGAGFLGSNLVRNLLAGGNEVVVLDNFVTGNKKFLESFESNNNLTTLTQDITEKISSSHFKDVDYIFNFACPASPPQYQRFPLRTLKTSLLGSINLLDLAWELKVPYFLASTSEIYGDPQISPQNEKYWGNVNPIGIRSCYDEGKRAAEALAMDYRRELGVDIKIVRIFNTFGPGMAIDDGRVMSNYIRNAIRNEPLQVFGDGSQTRSFCYVDDLIEGILKFALADKDVTGPINLGNTVEITMLELAKEVIARVESGSSIIFKDLPGDDPKQRMPDIRLAKSTLGWEPTTSYGDGINKMIEDFRKRVSI